jgi:hypothetical protein
MLPTAELESTSRMTRTGLALSANWAAAVLAARHVAVRHANINRVLITVREDRVYTGFGLWALGFRAGFKIDIDVVQAFRPARQRT